MNGNMNRFSRRQFLQRGGVALAGISLAGCTSVRPAPRRVSANEKLNIGIIGTAHRAAENIRGVEGENIVAICDIDEQLLAAAKERFPAAKTYHDFRKLLEQRDIDAVVVSTA